MRIAMLLTDTLPVPAVKGGAVQTGVQQLIEENEKNGKIDFTILSTSDEAAKKASKQYNKTKFYYLPSSNKLVKYTFKVLNKINKFLGIGKTFDENPKYTKAAIEILNKQSIDIVVVKNAYKMIRPLSKLQDTKLFLQLHNDYLNESIQDHKYIYDNSTNIITCSSYIKSRVLTIPNANPQKIYINKNCTDLELFNKEVDSKDVENLRTKFEISSQDKVILFIGRTVKSKGIEELLKSFKLLREKDSNYKLLIVGNKNFGGKSFDLYKVKLKKLSEGMENDIIFTGYIPYKKLPLVHSISEVAVVPSMWEEPAGRVVIEAQASGLPNVVSDSGGIPEYTAKDTSRIVKRDESFIENLAIEIHNVVTNQDLKEKMKIAGKENSLNYSPQRYYEELIDFLGIEKEEDVK